MKKALNWQVVLALILVTLSILFFVLHYIIFRDLRHIFFYLIYDIAFLFLDVLIVALVLQRLLQFREKQSVLKKLNMVIGTFFSEIGTELLNKLTSFDPGVSDIRSQLAAINSWTTKEFSMARKKLNGQQTMVGSQAISLEGVKELLVGKRQFLLNLLENASLLEHEEFTDLLWAVFDLTDELAHRVSLRNLPDKDYEHLSGDIKRAYQKLIIQWLYHMQHLKHDYPYLFSLAIRTNPFDQQASVVIKS